MKIHYLLVLCLSVCLLGACDLGKAGQNKIAVVNMTRVMMESIPGKAGLKFLEERQTSFQTKFTELQAKLEKDPKNEDLQKSIQELYVKSQQSLQAEQQNVVGMLNDAVQRVLNNFRKNKGYAVILASEIAISFDPAIDMTGAVIAEVNKEKLEFKPLPEPAPTKEQVAPQTEQKAPEQKAVRKKIEEMKNTEEEKTPKADKK